MMLGIALGVILAVLVDMPISTAACTGHTPGMAFKVWIADDDPEDCGDGDIYEFLAGGVLALHYSTPGRWSDYYQPTMWRHLAAEPNHRPGEPADKSIGPDFD